MPNLKFIALVALGLKTSSICWAVDLPASKVFIESFDCHKFTEDKKYSDEVLFQLAQIFAGRKFDTKVEAKRYLENEIEEGELLKMNELFFLKAMDCAREKISEKRS